VVGSAVAIDALAAFLAATEEPRHQGRIAKLAELDREAVLDREVVHDHEGARTP
jgi:hypothetical protein